MADAGVNMAEVAFRNQNMGAGKGGAGGSILQLAGKGKTFPTITGHFNCNIAEASPFSLSKLSPKLATHHIGVAPNALKGFGQGL